MTETAVAAKKKVSAADQAKAEKRQAAINKARSQAKGEIAEKYRNEVNERIAALVSEAGFDWAPTPTAEEKAAAELEKIYAEFPHLRPAVAETVTG